jgi:hypothetical protein
LRVVEALHASKRISDLVRIALVDEAIAIVVFAIASLDCPRMNIGVGVVTIHVCVVAVAVRIVGAGRVRIAILGNAIAAAIGSAGKHVRIIVVAVDRAGRRIAPRSGAREAIMVGVARGRWATFIDSAVAIVVDAVAKLPQRAAGVALVSIRGAAPHRCSRTPAGVKVIAVGEAGRRIAFRSGSQERISVNVAGQAALIDETIAVVIDAIATDFRRPWVNVRIVIVAICRRGPSIAVVIHLAGHQSAGAVVIDAIATVRIGKPAILRTRVRCDRIARIAVRIMVVAIARPLGRARNADRACWPAVVILVRAWRIHSVAILIDAVPAQLIGCRIDRWVAVIAVALRRRHAGSAGRKSVAISVRSGCDWHQVHTRGHVVGDREDSGRNLDPRARMPDDMNEVGAVARE